MHIFVNKSDWGHLITMSTRWGRGSKMSVFVHYQGIITVHAGRVKKWQNSVYVVVECPLATYTNEIFQVLFFVPC